MSRATTLLEFLTKRNPDIDYEEPKTKGNTSRRDFSTPEQVKKWDEFSFETLEHIYGGSLMDEARQQRSSLPSYPYLSPRADLAVQCEDTTRHVLTKWSHSIVQPALDAIPEAFNACHWSARRGAYRGAQDSTRNTPNYDGPIPGTGSSSLPRLAKKGTKSKPTRKPDAGTLLICRAHGASCPSSSLERLPKEYKTGSKWKSSDVLRKSLDESGRWHSGKRSSNEAMPIRQAFTYCVNSNCRYGCILSTEEAFIFRIKPRDSDTTKPLKKHLSSHGLMEYVSIPWSDEGSNKLTFNLSLWFLHVLAGNQNETDWDYQPLAAEMLTRGTCAASKVPVTPQSQPRRSDSKAKATTGSGSNSRKRPRSNSDDPTGIHFSFSESFRPTTQVSDQSSQFDDEDVSEAGSESAPRTQDTAEGGGEPNENAEFGQHLKRLRSGRKIRY